MAYIHCVSKNLIIGFQVTVENVGDVFLRHSVLYSYNLLLLTCCRRWSWSHHRQCINCCWPTDDIVTMTSRHCAHMQTER